MIFDLNDVFYILVEFEVDGMRPNESTKNGRKGAHGLNCKFFSILRSFSESTTKNTPEKKFSCLSDDFDFFVS